MSLIHPKSSECTKSELDLLTAPLTQLSMEDSRYVEIRPIAALGESIFTQCDITLGDRLISQSSAMRPYRTIIETLLNYSPATLKPQLCEPYLNSLHIWILFKSTGIMQGSIKERLLVLGQQNFKYSVRFMLTFYSAIVFC